MLFFFLYESGSLCLKKISTAELRKNKSKHIDSILKLFSEINYLLPSLVYSFLLRFISPLFNDNYLATSVFTTQRQSPWRSSLPLGTKEHILETRDLPNFCYKAQLRFHFYQEVFPPGLQVSLCSNLPPSGH